jgi:hypothetical protein
MSTQVGMVPASEVVTRAAQALGDPSQGHVGRTRYREFVFDGLRELCFDAEWDHRYIDEPIPTNRIVPLPMMSGLRNIWVYRGPSCDNTSRISLPLKENYIHNGNAGSFANDNWNNTEDPMIGSHGWSENLAFGAVHQSNLYLSPGCSQWERVKIEYVGIGIDKLCQDEDFKVPLWAMEALRHYVTMRGAEHMIHVEGRERTMQGILQRATSEMKLPSGSWMEARARWGGLDHKDRGDLVRVLTRIGKAA